MDVHSGQYGTVWVQIYVFQHSKNRSITGNPAFSFHLAIGALLYRIDERDSTKASLIATCIYTHRMTRVKDENHLNYVH